MITTNSTLGRSSGMSATAAPQRMLACSGRSWTHLHLRHRSQSLSPTARSCNCSCCTSTASSAAAGHWRRRTRAQAHSGHNCAKRNICGGDADEGVLGNTLTANGSENVLFVQDERSYYEQFQDLKGSTDLNATKVAYPKPKPGGNFRSPQPLTYPLSDVVACKVERPLLRAAPKTFTAEQADAQQRFIQFERITRFSLMHLIFFTGCWFTFSGLHLAIGLAAAFSCTAVGVAVTYHRLLSHRSFKTHLAVEYTMAYLALHALQGPPLEWVSNHRNHHLHCDTPLDLHSPYEGFWHAYMGWVFCEGERHLWDRANVQDLARHTFYNFLERTWVAHMLGRFLLTWGLFGWGAVVWTYAFPSLIGWHSTFLVNTAAHLWGTQPYESGDLSRNNWFVGLIVFGEGWHNNHHAFPRSARHGFEWYQVDTSYYVICALQAVGLAWDVLMPSEADKARKRKPASPQATR